MPVRIPARRALVAGTALVLLAACGGSAAESAKTLIEDRLADDIGLGELTATCNEPPDLKEGETFTCTAATTDGRTIEFVGELISDDEFNVQTTNLLTESDVTLIVEAVVDAINTENGTSATTDDVVCPSGTLLLDDADGFDCELTDTTSGEVFNLRIDTGGLEPGGGPLDLSYEIS